MTMRFKWDGYKWMNTWVVRLRCTYDGIIYGCEYAFNMMELKQHVAMIKTRLRRKLARHINQVVNV